MIHLVGWRNEPKSNPFLFEELWTNPTLHLNLIMKE